jgi:hypothetical protein
MAIVVMATIVNVGVGVVRDEPNLLPGPRDIGRVLNPLFAAAAGPYLHVERRYQQMPDLPGRRRVISRHCQTRQNTHPSFLEALLKPG